MKTIVFAGCLALLGTLLGTRLAILVLVKKGYGQLIRDDGPTSHHVKRGTPTRGGLVIIAAVLFAYFGSHLITFTAPSASALLVLFLFTGLGVVGEHAGIRRLVPTRLGQPARVPHLGVELRLLEGLDDDSVALLHPQYSCPPLCGECARGGAARCPLRAAPAGARPAGACARK